MTENDYDPIGGHTKEEADAAYEALFKELHGSVKSAGEARGAYDGCGGDEGRGAYDGCGAYESRSAYEPGGGKVAVVGRRDPDADSICAAIAYARLKNETDPENEYVPCRAGELDAETKYALEYFGEPQPPRFSEWVAQWAGEARPGIILVDHNDMSQVSDGIDMADVIEIIDHHRLAGAETPAPVCVRCQPCGAACTIIYGMYQERGIDPGSATAGLMCAAIISDTRLLRAPETTRADRLACAALANIAGLELEAFANTMLSCGCDGIASEYGAAESSRERE